VLLCALRHRGALLAADRASLHRGLAFRLLAGNQAPDHVTIARFRVRHEQALAGFLVASLKLCTAAGMVRVGTVALDGTKLDGNAAEKANRTQQRREGEVAEILRQAAALDECDAASTATSAGTSCPGALASKAGRPARLRQAKAQLEAEAAERERRYQQRVAELAAAARAKGKQPRAHIKPRAVSASLARTASRRSQGMTGCGRR
jgi:hypothetical protein